MQENAKKQKNKKKEPFIDDGRVIASMNMEEISSYAPKSNPSHSLDRQTIEPIELSAKGKIAMITGMLKAALLVGVVFIGGIGLFILFCVFVWFR